MLHKTFSLFLVLSVLSHNISARELLLTGIISSSAKQVVRAPKGDRWQTPIQWMEEEGKIVERGAPIVIFDGTAELNKLLLQHENLERLELDLRKLELELEQALTDAKGNATIANLQVNKAKIEASVPDTQVSVFEKGQYELELQKALLEESKAEEEHNKVKLQKEAELTKKNIEISKTKAEIDYLNNILSQLKVLAKYTGPVSYSTHPWLEEKLSAGMNVRAGWKVIEVQSTSSFQIETWIHEIDVADLKVGAKVNIVLDAYPQKVFPGKIINLSTQSEPRVEWSKSVYFPAIVQFEKMPKQNLRQGMSVRIHVKMEHINA